MNTFNTTVPIAYSTDDNYAIPVAVSIKSIIEHAKHKDFIFFILYKNHLSKKSIDAINLSIKGTNSSINYIDIKDSITNVYLPISHISESGYYRFLLPNLLEDYNQCLYLDGDIIAVNSIMSLLELKLNDEEYIGAVRCESLLNSVFTYRNEHKKELGLESLSQYINSGVLLMNLKSMRERKLVDKMIQMIDMKYSIQDQDIYSVICFNHIKLIDPMYNVVPGILEKTKFELLNAYSIKQIAEARKTPVLIHFADKRKPWDYEGMKYGEKWDELYYSLFKKNVKNRKKYVKKSFIQRNALIVKNGIKYIFRKVFIK